jgi:hypothetical protein
MLIAAKRPELLARVQFLLAGDGIDDDVGSVDVGSLDVPTVPPRPALRVISVNVDDEDDTFLKLSWELDTTFVGHLCAGNTKIRAKKWNRHVIHPTTLLT